LPDKTRYPAHDFKVSTHAKIFNHYTGQCRVWVNFRRRKIFAWMLDKYSSTDALTP
jgi:hypothetical protein